MLLQSFIWNACKILDIFDINMVEKTFDFKFAVFQLLPYGRENTLCIDTGKRVSLPVVYRNSRIMISELLQKMMVNTGVDKRHITGRSHEHIGFHMMKSCFQ